MIFIREIKWLTPIRTQTQPIAWLAFVVTDECILSMAISWNCSSSTTAAKSYLSNILDIRSWDNFNDDGVWGISKRMFYKVSVSMFQRHFVKALSPVSTNYLPDFILLIAIFHLSSTSFPPLQSV